MAQAKQLPGTIGWHDLTVKNADEVRDFYAKVVGWKVMPIEMGGYNDYCMLPPKSEAPAGGVCHKRGANKGVPSQWLMYVIVENLAAALRRCKKSGGKQLTKSRRAGSGKFAVIQDPAGAVCGLYECD